MINSPNVQVQGIAANVVNITKRENRTVVSCKSKKIKKKISTFSIEKDHSSALRFEGGLIQRSGRNIPTE